MAPRKVIIDGDPGTDDAKAILLLLNEPDIQVLAITVTQGNTTLENASKNTRIILSVADRKDIKIYEGSYSSMVDKDVKADNFFGGDGMGDTGSKYDRDLQEAQKERAVLALTELVNIHKGEVTLICLGPLTNIALAVKLDKTFGSKLKACYIMGGNYLGRGNITPAAEFNFHRDPEAAYVVFKELPCPITLVTWELCLSLNLTWEWYDKITSKKTKYSNFLKDIGAKMASANRQAGAKFYVLADELAAACFIDRTLALDAVDVVCSVELNGDLTRGQVVVDWKASENPSVKKNIKIVKKIDVERFKALVEKLAN